MIAYKLVLVLALTAQSSLANDTDRHLRSVDSFTEESISEAQEHCTPFLAEYEECVNSLDTERGDVCTTCVNSQFPTGRNEDFCLGFQCDLSLAECGCSECAAQAVNFLVCIFDCADDLCQTSPSSDVPSDFPTSSPTLSPLAMVPSTCVSTCILVLEKCMASCDAVTDEFSSSQQCNVADCVDMFNTCVGPCLA